MHKVSIVIPVYKTEKYLSGCIDSIINQTYKNIEIICINDCSPDNSREIIKYFMKEDNRIKLIDFKENKGVAVARNTAMINATGEYIGFVDPDDWIDLNFYENLYNKAKVNDSDLVIGNIKSVAEDKEISLNLDYNTFKRYKVFYGLFQIGLYSKVLLDKYKINFTQGRSLGEDRLLPIMASYYAKNMYMSEEVFYHQLHRADSATKNMTLEKIQDYDATSKSVIEFLNSTNIDEEKYNVIFKSFWMQALNYFINANDKLREVLTNFIYWMANNMKYGGGGA